MQAALILEQALGPVPGGTGRYSIELARALAAGAPEGSSVTGWTAWHRDAAAAEVPGVRGPKTLPLARRPLTLAWERRVGPVPRGADVVHAPTLLMPPRRGTPLVVTIHDAVPWTHPDTLTPRGVRWHRAMAEYAARVADRIIVPTHAVAEDLRAVLPLDDRVRVIGHGVTELTPGDGVTELRPDESAAGLELPAEGYLMTLATLEPRKGLDTLIAALADPAAPKLPLLIVGQPGWGGVDPVAEAARQGIDADRIRVLGRIDDALLARVLRQAMMLVMPSRAEGFGLPLVEAMAAGTAVVHSDAPALVEVGGGAGRVVPRDSPRLLAEALREVAEDETLRAQLVAAGRKHAEQYTWSAVAEAVWGLYAALR
ncbi:MAG TPA: glycosyltransferase family 1 protein [Mycobacteriales bacterium]|nr:glycosyltransferase family 1 protein [Mycobacteriales bacterium]